MKKISDLTRNSRLVRGGRYLVKSREKELALLASTQVWEGGLRIVVDYGDVQYIKITDGENTFADIAKLGEPEEAPAQTGLTVAPSSPLKPTSVWVGTQAQYDAIVTKNPLTFYNIVE